MKRSRRTILWCYLRAGLVLLSIGVVTFSFNRSTVLAASDLAPSDDSLRAAADDWEAVVNDTPFYDGETSCLTGSAAGGPLFGVHFPQTGDVGLLAQRIDDYIGNTRPDSPLKGLGNQFVQKGKDYNVNPALTVALAQKETSLGTAGYARPPKYNVFNVRNGPGGSFGGYASYEDALDKVNKLLSGPLYLGPPSNFTTVTDVMFRYAPPADHNDTTGYIQFINDIFQKILSGAPDTAGKPVATEPAAGVGCGSADSGSGIVSTDGYAFPLAPQKKSQISAGYNLPCASTCHHDGTPAFDLAHKPLDDSTAGAAVYALTDGTVENLHTYMGIEGCYSFQLHSSKDSYFYWYGHLQNPSATEGQTVKAGQKLAEVGIRKCTGNGSYPHLHIDRGCTVGGKQQRGGRVSCRDRGMVEIINKLWAELPE